MQEYEKVRQLAKQVQNAFSSQERTQAEVEWTNISKYVLPGQWGSFTSTGLNPSKGAKVTNAINDSTPIKANHDLAAAIHSTLTNPATAWSKYRFKTEDLNNDDEAITWLEDTTRRIHEALNDSSFDNDIAKAYKMYTSIGNMAVLFEELPKNEIGGFEGFNFTALHMGEIAWSENSRGIVDTAYRRITITARQAAERFGEENLSGPVKQDLLEYPDKERQYFHIIAPRKPKDIKLVNGVGKPKDLPFSSIYLDPSDNVILEEGGYYEFPILAVRWETAPGEVYGRGPGHMAYPDIRTLNLTKELYFKSFAKAVSPSWFAIEKGMVSDLNVKPDGVTYVKSRDALWQVPTETRFDVTQNGIQELQLAIKELFFLDKLMLPPRDTHGEMTAYEVQQRVEQMQRVLGPTLGRLNAELLKPLIVRAFKIMLRAGALGSLPESVRQSGIDIDIEFVNQLARSQKAQDVIAIQDWTQFLGLLAQLGKPEALDWINIDFTPPHIARIRGVPEGAIADEQTVKAIREQRAQIQQQQMQLDSQMKAADIQSKQSSSSSQQGGGQ